MIALGNRPYRCLDSERPAPLPIESVRKYARRARIYLELFHQFPTKEAASKVVQSWKAGSGAVKLKNAQGIVVQLGCRSGEEPSYYNMIEKLYKEVKTHSNTIDFDWSVCTDST